MQRVSDRAAYTVLLAVGVVCVLAFLLIRLPRAEQSVLTADGPGYFSYLRSVLIDGDLDFRNEYKHFGYCIEGDTPTGMMCLLPWIQNPTSTGLVGNPLSVGTPLLWAPFYLTAHTISLIAHAASLPAAVDGYGYLYESAISIATIAYVTAGCLLTYRVCRRYFSPYSSLLAVLGVYLASSLIHYTVAAPYMSHGLSFFAVSLFVFVWHPPRSRTHRQWILLGLSAGLMTLVRTQNVLYLSMLAIEAIEAVGAGAASRRAAILKEYVKGGMAVGLVGAVVLVPQMLVWNILYGSPITFPQRSGYFDWLHPDLFEYLFSTRPGLFTWTPIMLLATIGFLFMWRRDRLVTIALLIPLILQWYVNSAIAGFTEDYQYAFGARRIVSATPLFMLGMAALTESMTKRLRRGALVMLGAVTALVGWNLLAELQYSLGFIAFGEPLTWNQLVVGKFRMVLALIGRVVPLP